MISRVDSVWPSLRCVAILLTAALFTNGSIRADSPGESLYKSKCVACHGPQGEGAKSNKVRLEGDKSVAQLADVVRKTMPQDDPGTLTADESKAVAAYIHEAFYSAVARERLRLARIELARLTVSQYRSALTDLVGSFREMPKWGAERGLRGEYFAGRRLGGRKERAVERIDREVAFDFGRDAPVSAIAEPHEFSARWTGSLLAPETGEYEFVVRTEHAIRLWVNETNTPLIDAWVKSGSDTEYRGTLFLIGGRIYPVKLEYTKAKQGVDDSKNQKQKPPSAKSSIALLWKRPNRAAEVVPSRNLSPGNAPPRFCSSVPFPPDDRSYGWERATSISKEWDQATTDAALEATDHVARRANEFAGTKDGAGDRRDKLIAFCRTFAARAFRRPLSDEAAQMLIVRQFDESSDLDVALRRVLLLVLKSPRFLYREVEGPADGYSVAARLSFGLWDSIPDSELTNAARDGKLESRDQIARQAERMLADPRAAARLRTFLLTWLKSDTEADIAKDADAYPGFDAAVISDLRTSLEIFLDDLLASDKADFRRLLTAEELPLNERLMAFYGLDLPATAELPDRQSLPDNTFRTFRLDDGRRAGILTHPYLMARHAYHSETSPIHRGVFVVRGVLGRMLRPPPDAVVPIPPSLHPTLTTRERITLQTKPANCITCHSVINPLGFPLENFDAVGRWRDTERGRPVDPAGSYLAPDGKAIPLSGARELATYLAASDETHAAFAEQLFHFLVQQPLRAYGLAAREDLRKSFVENDFNIRRLAVDTMVRSALVGRDGVAQRKEK